MALHGEEKRVLGGETDGRFVLRPTERLDRSHARHLWIEANRLFRKGRPARIVVDLRGVSRIDEAGVALLRELEARCRRGHVEFAVEGANPAVSEFLEFVGGRSPDRCDAPPAQSAPAKASLLDRAARGAQELRALIELVGQFAESAAYLATHPHRIRFRDVVYQIQRVGADGMWLVVGLSLLLGVIMAFQGLSGARGFGSPIFVADVVTLSTTREMAPLLTGVIVTGRSGAAIAAEIGTMKIDQELDALAVMGFDVMQFLLVPRALALVVAAPLLTIVSIGAGILGGATVAMSVLHLSLISYFGEVQRALSAAQIMSALAKGATFGLLIGVISCFEGLRARNAAEEVGKQTTAAVVRSILLVILADAVFSVLTEVSHW